MEYRLSFPRLTTCLPNERRHDLFRDMHKALRAGHCQMVTALGAHDFSGADETRQLLEGLRGFLGLNRLHLEGEASEIHPVVDTLRPPPMRMDHDHAGHRRALAEIESLIRSVEVATPARRNIAGHALYRCYALFAAADMEEMNDEETRLLGILHDAVADDQLHGMESRILLSFPPPSLAALTRLLIGASSRRERVAVLAKLRSLLASEAFSELLTCGVEPCLNAADYDAALREIGH